MKSKKESKSKTASKPKKASKLTKVPKLKEETSAPKIDSKILARINAKIEQAYLQIEPFRRSHKPKEVEEVITLKIPEAEVIAPEIPEIES